MSFLFFKRFYLLIFSEREREGEREGEKHQCVVAPHVPSTEDMVHNPGMCPEPVTFCFAGWCSIH